MFCNFAKSGPVDLGFLKALRLLPHQRTFEGLFLVLKAISFSFSAFLNDGSFSKPIHCFFQQLLFLEFSNKPLTSRMLTP